jgi:replicative DNA helicase
LSQGKLLLCSVVKTGNKNYLNRIKDELFTERPLSGEKLTEKAMLAFFRKHVLSFRVLPSPDAMRGAGIEYVETTQPPEYYIEEIKKRAAYNAYAKFKKDLTPYLETGLDLDKVYELSQEFSHTISHLSVSDKFKSVAELGRDIEFELEQRKNGNADIFVPFGWPTLDRITGGIGGGDLGYFIARPGKGKSQLITHMAHHAWTQGHSPLVLTMEMTDIQIARRLYGIKGQFNHDALRRGIPDNEVERKLSEAISGFETGPDFNIICGQTRQTVESITSLVDELNPDVLYIDAAYLINMKGSQAKAWEKIAQIGERLKELAITRNIPIIMTVQFNRDAAKGKAGGFDGSLENIAGSDAIGQLGSIIVAIREAEEPYTDTRRTLAVIKNREGGICEFDINFTFDPPDFSEVMTPTRNTEAEIAFIT